MALEIPSTENTLSYEEAANILFIAYTEISQHPDMQSRWNKFQQAHDVDYPSMLSIESFRVQKRFVQKDADIETSLHKIVMPKNDSQDFYENSLRYVQWFENLASVAKPTVNDMQKKHSSHLTELGLMRFLAICSLHSVNTDDGQRNRLADNVDFDGLQRVFNQPIAEPSPNVLAVYKRNFGSASKPMKWFNSIYNRAVNDYCAQADYLHTPFRV